MRLQQAIYVDKPVESIKLRLETKDIPVSAGLLITDVQLQAGELSTGKVPNPREVGTDELGPQYRNGVINPGLEIIALSNSDKAVPVKMQVRNAKGEPRIGSYRFGPVNGTATVDGRNHTASHGYGMAPVITERQDLTMIPSIHYRLHLRLSWNERE